MTAGHDHTCRVWKIPEESQLIFRAHAPAVDCVRYITATQVLCLCLAPVNPFESHHNSSGDFTHEACQASPVGPV